MRDDDGFVRSRAGSCEGPGAPAAAGANVGGAGMHGRLSKLGGRTYGGIILDGPPCSMPGRHDIDGGVQHAAPELSGAIPAALKNEHDIISS